MDIRLLFDTNEDFHTFVMNYIRKNGITIEKALRDKVVIEESKKFANNSDR